MSQFSSLHHQLLLLLLLISASADQPSDLTPQTKWPAISERLIGDKATTLLKILLLDIIAFERPLIYTFVLTFLIYLHICLFTVRSGSLVCPDQMESLLACLKFYLLLIQKKF